MAEALARSSFDLPAGTMETRDGDSFIRFLGESRTPEAFARIPLTASPLGAEVLLGDVATITTRFSEDYDATYFNSRRAAIVEIAKTDD